MRHTSKQIVLGMRQNLSKHCLVLSATLLAPTLASAHVGGGIAGGFSSGFTHPIFGYDHLLAMLAVGIWGAQLGGRSLWTLPVVFPLIMAAGGFCGSRWNAATVRRSWVLPCL